MAAYTHHRAAMVSSTRREDSSYGSVGWHNRDYICLFREDGEGSCIVYICDIEELLGERKDGRHGVLWSNVEKIAQYKKRLPSEIVCKLLDVKPLENTDKPAKDTEAKKSKNINHKKYAKKCLAYLVKHIRDFKGGNKYITYGELAEAVNYPKPYTGNLFGKQIGETLGVMGHLFDGMTIDGETIPIIQALVVNSGNKLPSDGLKEFNPSYPKLTATKKKDFLLSEYKKIFSFGGRWDKVLHNLNITPIGKKYSKRKPGRGLYNPYGSEGSPEHRALRDYIAAHPEMVGYDKNITGVPEYPLRSGDSVDVVFESLNKLLGVEVKSERSGNDDIERGLYQCIKYSAVLKSERDVNQKKYDVDCVLVLATALPRQLYQVRDKLGITVFENIEYK